MDMSRFLIGRISAVALLILFVAFAFALWRANLDVEHESRGAAEVVHAFAQLAALQDEHASQVDVHLAQLRAIVEGGGMRHLSLRVDDGDGKPVIAPAPASERALIERAFVALLPPVQRGEETTWTIRRTDGREFVARFMIDPVSEQDEALDDTLGLLGMLSGCVLLILVAVAWAVRRALAPLQPIHTAIEHYRRTDYGWRVPPLPMRELDAVGASLNQLSGALAHAQDVRRLLSVKLLSLQEDERARIARELHDELGQVLTAMRADAAWLSRRSADRPDVQAVADELSSHCARIQEDVRNLLRELRPLASRIEAAPVPLASMLADLVESWRERPGQDVRIALEIDAQAQSLDDDFALALYRMTQEALTNVMRHADARHVVVRLAVDADGAIDWSVADDGIGLDDGTGALHRGNGLAGINERAWAYDGEVGFEAGGGAAEQPGLRVYARFPARTAALR